ncbi:MAG: hypothetical protein Q2306_00470 [Phytoplasma sp.]|uniref:hypothetical protein n=1 Tax=Phytoplasma sp. TaxID=2155 RepID=UPI002B4148D9|nr:hypothetical protein [Phytoplasma sp.]WRH06807.1 MAG: hypothetical protein Q2306_00470 [Phytoplasma sp.]
MFVTKLIILLSGIFIGIFVGAILYKFILDFPIDKLKTSKSNLDIWLIKWYDYINILTNQISKFIKNKK